MPALVDELVDDLLELELVVAVLRLRGGGRVVGASDKDAMEPAERPVKPSDLHATVCHALGIDHEKEVYTPQDRPMVLIREGAEPVKELFA